MSSYHGKDDMAEELAQQVIMADYNAIEICVAQAVIDANARMERDIVALRNRYMSPTGRTPSAPNYSYKGYVAAGPSIVLCPCSTCRGIRAQDEEGIQTPMHPSARQFAYEENAARSFNWRAIG